MKTVSFEWDDDKDQENIKKHGVSLFAAQHAFFDPKRVIVEDVLHSTEESRYYCIARVGDGIMTVRFTYRENVIRIYGAGYWRKGKRVYAQQNKV